MLASRQPTRLIARRMTDFFLRATAALSAPAKGDLTETLVMTTVVLANVSHIPYSAPEAERTAAGEDGPGEGLRRPVSVNAVARSLGIPFETVRQRVQRLEAAGALVRDPQGVAAPPAVVASSVRRRAWLGVYAAMETSLAALAAHGVDVAALSGGGGEEPGERRPSPQLCARIALDALLRLVERFSGAFGSLTRGHLYLAVIDANTGHLDLPPNPPLRYAFPDTPPPDAERRPIPVRALARALATPLETARRNAERLVTDGWMVMEPGRGLYIPSAVLQRPEAMELAMQSALASARFLADLRRAGYAFPAPVTSAEA